MSRGSWKFIALAVGTIIVSAVAAVSILALLMNISDRKHEAKSRFSGVVELTDSTDLPGIWGQNFPQHYDGYRETARMTPTRYGGSKRIERTPTPDDPREFVSQSKLDENPALRRMWAGYAFSRDFREERGHHYMLLDQIYTKRQGVPQPGTCLNCHASTYTAQMKLGEGNLVVGFEKMNQMPYQEAAKLVSHPVGCIDCHEPATMRLRVTKPAFIEGMREYRKAMDGIEDYDVNRDASRQEMRAYVCGQCHVEYYFNGKEKRLAFPWTKGMRADSILAFYDEIGFKDWVHEETGAPCLKAQHPEFELWNQGIHARSGVTCADCHMPFKRQGAMKTSDHHVNSPLLKPNLSCQICHHWPEAELRSRVEKIQDVTTEMKGRAMTALMDLIEHSAAARKRGASDQDLKEAREYQRKASFLLDFAEAENSTGFHAPQEVARILQQATDYARKGQIVILESAPKSAPITGN